MEHDTMICEVCDGEGLFLGNLGNLAHYRCRDCGIQFSVEGAEGDAEVDFDDVQAWEDDCYEYEDDLSDVEADAMTLASAGMGTDEDYGFYGDELDGCYDDF
jgi:hypothetical protein